MISPPPPQVIIRGPFTCWYFYRLKRDDYVSEFCLAGWAQDPEQYVATLDPNGQWQRWHRRQEGDLLVFRPPDGYRGDQGLGWYYNRQLQVGEAMPRKELEKRALNSRVSVNFFLPGE